MEECLQIRVHGDAALPTLVYLPGMHGDWTLVSSFRAAVAGRVRFVEFSYPRTTTWTLDELAAAIEGALLSRGIRRGWLLGESFGSTPAWQLIRREQASATAPAAARFHAIGLILAGGFVRHPVNWAVRMAGGFSGAMPMAWVRGFCRVYAAYARFRHKQAPETLASIGEFVANRTSEADRRAIVHRYDLIADNDLRPVARQFDRPVHYLAGLVDPLVPWCLVRRWLTRHCPGYRGGRTVWTADHNVLGTQPREAARQILHWMKGDAQTEGRRHGYASLKPSSFPQKGRA